MEAFRRAKKSCINYIRRKTNSVSRVEFRQAVIERDFEIGELLQLVT